MKYDSIADFALWLWNSEVSPAQITALKTWNGEKLTWKERSLWRKMAETQLFARYAPRRHDEAVWIKGRQGGGSTRLACTAILWTAFCEEHVVAPGERLSVLCFAPVLRMTVFQIVAEKIASIPELAELVESDNSAAGELRLSNGIDILEISANPAYARGKTAILVVIDEAAFLHSDQEFTNNLTDLLESVRPSLIVKRGRLLLLSSPGGTEGPLHKAWVERAENPDVLVLRAPSVLLNPSIDPKLLERERKRGGEAFYKREYLAEFTDTSGTPFLNPFSIDEAVKGSPPEFAPAATDLFVFSGIDLADRRDWCSICHVALRDIEGVRKIVVLSSKVWKPGPDGHKVLTILREMGQDCQRYNSHVARGDQKSMSVAEQVLAEYGVVFTRVISEGAGSEQGWRTFSGLLNEHRIVLCNNEELVQQLRRVEEKATDGNRFLVQGRKNTKDDCAVACMNACAAAAERFSSGAPIFQCVSLYDDQDDEASHDRWFHKIPQN